MAVRLSVSFLLGLFFCRSALAAGPTINANDKVAECRSPSVSVWINPQVTSTVDPLPTVTYSNRLASDGNAFPTNTDPDQYPVGSRPVTISACDHVTPTHNCTSKSINVNVRDTLGPTIVIPTNKQVQCISPAGIPAAAGYCVDTCRTSACDPNTSLSCASPNQVSAACTTCKNQYNTCANTTCPQDANTVHMDKPVITDICDGNPTWVSNAPVAPFTFPIGKTTIKITAGDYSGNVSSKNVLVQVLDTVAPLFDASVVPSFNVVSYAAAAASPLHCTAVGGVNGTLVTLTHPNATDLCTLPTQMAYSWRVGSNAETQNPQVCVADGNNIIQFIVRDAVGNTDTVNGAASKRTTVRVAPAASFTLSLALDAVNSSYGFVPQGKVKASASGATGGVTWNLVGAAAPDSAPGSTSSLNLTYSTEGAYCPLYVSATDSAAHPGASNPLCFGVDNTPPGHVFSGIPAVPNPITSVFVDGALIPLDITAADSLGTLPSGVAHVTAYLKHGSDANILLYDNTYCSNGNSSNTQLPVCASTHHVTGCNQVGQPGCSCQTVNSTTHECAGDGRLDLSQVAPGPYTLYIGVTDLAGNLATTGYAFSVGTLPTNLVGDPNNPVGGMVVQLSALAANPNTSVAAKTAINLAKQYVQSAGVIFSESPGQALLLVRQAWTQLDTARSNGATVDSLQTFLANVAEGEVRRIAVAVQNQLTLGKLSTWSILGEDPAVRGVYKSRRFLVNVGGPLRDYAVDPTQTLRLAQGLLAIAAQHIVRNETSSAIDSAVSTYDALSTLFQDQPLSALYNINGGAGHTIDVGTPANPNIIPEAYFRQGPPSHFGSEVSATVSAQIGRFSAKAQGGALFGVAPSALATLQTATTQIAQFSAAVRVVQNANWQATATNFSNNALVQQVYLPAVTALQTLQTLSGSSIYTRYWQTGLGFTLADVVNFSMYEGPTALSCILWGSDSDGLGDTLYDGCSTLRANGNTPLIYTMTGTITSGHTPDFEAQVAECRYNHMMYALGDGRLLGSGAGALDLFVQSKCQIINLYNRYYGNRATPYVSGDVPIDPTAYGCPATPATFTQADALAACGGCNVGGAKVADTTCDGLDTDCNGSVDDGFVPVSCGCAGLDLTTYVCPCAASSACINGQSLPCVPGVPLTTVDTLCNGQDNACTGHPATNYVPVSCGVGGCTSYSACTSGHEQACTPKAAQAETCNGTDDNCNISVDEGLDNDHDSYGCAPCQLYTTAANCGANVGCSWSGGACTGPVSCTQCIPGSLGCTTSLLCSNDKSSSGAWTGVWDCDDQDPVKFPGNPEVCDGKDNNCNGVIDEGVINACGNCDPQCAATLIGQGGSPFDPNPINASNINQNPNGGLGLTTQNLNLQYAWIANDTAGTVSKLDMTTGKEVARYCQAIKTGVTSFVGGKDPTGATYDTRSEPTVCAGCGGCNNGSRTAVDGSGNMLMANRAYSDNGYVGTYSKVAGNVANCVDVNGDGVIQTSLDRNGDGVIDPNLLLPASTREYWGELDECILWTRKPITWDRVKQPSCNAANWPPNDATKDPTNTSFADEKATCLADPNSDAGVCQWVNACNGSGDTSCVKQKTQVTCQAINLGANCTWGASCTGISGCETLTTSASCKVYTGYCTWSTGCTATACSTASSSKTTCSGRSGCTWNQDCYNIGDGPLTNVAMPMPRAMAIDAQGDAWVGLFNRQGFMQINPQNGYIKRWAYTGYSPYGSSLDQHGILWHSDSCCGSQTLAGLNTNPNTVTYVNPDNGNVTFNWAPYATQASKTVSPGGSYGVATDKRGYVYIGSYPLVNIAGFRFDAYRNSWTTIYSSTDSKGNVLADAGVGRGTAVSPDGVIWIAQMGNSGGGRVTGFNPNTLQPVVDVDYGSKGQTPIGVGVGYAGRIWTSNQASYNVAVVDPTTSSVGYYPVGGPPYCYSDFTGAVLRTFTAPTGSYSEVIDACYGFQVNQWVNLLWNGILPVGTQNQGRAVSNTALRFRIRGTNNLVTHDASGNAVDPSTASTWSLWFPDDVSNPSKNASDPNRVYYWEMQPQAQWPTSGYCANLQSRVFTAATNSYTIAGCADISALPTTYVFDTTVGVQPISYVQVQAVLASDGDNTVQPTLTNFQVARTCPQF